MFALAKITDVRPAWHGLHYGRIATLQMQTPPGASAPVFAGPEIVLDHAMLAGLNVGDVVRLDVRPATDADRAEWEGHKNAYGNPNAPAVNPATAG